MEIFKEIFRMLFKRRANLYALGIGSVWLLIIALLWLKGIKITLVKDVAMTFGILTTNILFSWQVIDNINRLDDIIYDKNKNLKEKDNINNSIVTVTDATLLETLKEKHSNYEKLLKSRDIVFDAHLSFTLGVVVSIFFILIGSIEYSVRETVETVWGFGLAQAGGFGCFAVGYGELVYSSSTIQKGIRTDWEEANNRRIQLEKKMPHWENRATSHISNAGL